MAYGYPNYYFPATYQPLVYPQPQPQQQNVPYVPQAQQQQTSQSTSYPPLSGVAWVDGVEAAKAQNVPYGTSVVFFDSKQPLFYIKTVGLDGVPKPLVIRRYEDVTEEELTKPAEQPTEKAEYMTRAEVEERLASMTQFVTEEELEDRVLRVIQEKMMPKAGKTAAKSAAPKEE